MNRTILRTDAGRYDWFPELGIVDFFPTGRRNPSATISLVWERATDPLHALTMAIRHSGGSVFETRLRALAEEPRGARVQP